MSFLMLTVCDARGSWHGHFPLGFVHAVLAALSAEPETLAELETALGRFCDERIVAGFHAKLMPGEASERQRGENVVIDLPGRLICCDSTTVLPEQYGQIVYHDDEGPTRVHVTYFIADDWRVRDSCDDWRAESRSRRLHRDSFRPFDVRQVLYGTTLCRFLAAEVCKSKHDREEDPVRAIHAIWLSTPRDDLQGRAPRDVMLERREEVDADIEARAMEWTSLGRCPPGLPRDSQAFLCGGFGTHEIVLYYDLIRYLLTTAWEQPRPASVVSEAALAEWLEALHDEWLASTTKHDLAGQSPRGVIELERARIPLTIDDSESMYDHDCPLCQMMAEQGTGPTFYHLDGSAMDDDFVFSFYESVDEWEKDQADYEQYVESLESARPERDDIRMPEPCRIWSCSSLNRALLPTLPPGQRIYLLTFDLTANVAELKIDTTNDPALATLARRIETRLNDVRNAIKDRAVWQLDGLLDACGTAVDDLRRESTELGEKCGDFRAKLELLRQSFQEVVPG